MDGQASFFKNILSRQPSAIRAYSGDCGVESCILIWPGKFQYWRRCLPRSWYRSRETTTRTRRLTTMTTTSWAPWNAAGQGHATLAGQSGLSVHAVPNWTHLDSEWMIFDDFWKKNSVASQTFAWPPLKRTESRRQIHRPRTTLPHKICDNNSRKNFKKLSHLPLFAASGGARAPLRKKVKLL